LGKKKSEHKNEVLRFGALQSVATKAEERPLIEHNARQNANARRNASVIPSEVEGPRLCEPVTQTTLVIPPQFQPMVLRISTGDSALDRH
jgi:hypothetical protein